MSSKDRMAGYKDARHRIKNVSLALPRRARASHIRRNGSVPPGRPIPQNQTEAGRRRPAFSSKLARRRVPLTELHETGLRYWPGGREHPSK